MKVNLIGYEIDGWESVNNNIVYTPVNLGNYVCQGEDTLTAKVSAKEYTLTGKFNHSVFTISTIA